MKQLKDKLFTTPYCYLTGVRIDFSNPETYTFDHILPVSKDGTNSISNLGLSTRQANLAKNDMTVEEFLELCEKVLRNFGYTVIKNVKER